MYTFLKIICFVSLAGNYVNGEAIDGEAVPEYLEFHEKWQRAIAHVKENEDWVKIMQDDLQNDEPYPFDDVIDVPFECVVDDAISPSAASVHRLKPTDVSVVAAFGDSITAGNGLGARLLPEVIFENRGESWSVGGDAALEHGRITLTNILKKFNKNIKGGSICRRRVTHDHAWMNVAVPGATNRNMPDQADDMISKMYNDPFIDWTNDWKVVTLFIGGNDLCAVCRREDRYNPDAYRDNIEEALDKLHEVMPRTYVNLVAMMPVDSIVNITDYRPWCNFFQNQFCDCAVQDPQHTREVQLQYYDKLKELVDSRKYDSRDDFTVVLQPHMRDQYPLVDEETGTYDYTYFSPDCFHPSRKGHQEMAFILWNVMMMPEHEKPFHSGPEDHPGYRCPTEEHPYIFTHLNTNWNEQPTTTTTTQPSTTTKQPSTGGGSTLGASALIVMSMSLLIFPLN